MAGALYVVATPIGNLSDITPRAADTLRAADFIIAEDTRVSRKLLAYLDIKKQVYSCHKFNEAARLDFFIEKLTGGQSAALVSDAGTPCLSDPGHLLVRGAVIAGVDVVPVAGVSAITAALSVSGFDAQSFAFYGFPPKKNSELTKMLDVLKQDSPRVAVIYESPLRVVRLLDVIAEAFPGADVCVCNDLTKKFERIYRGKAADVLGELKQNPDHEKGEYTLVLDKSAGAGGEAADTNGCEANDRVDDVSVEALLVDICIKNGVTVKEAVNIAAQKKGARKKDIYAASLRLKEVLLHS